MQARLASETDIAGFREEAHALLAHQVPPEDVQWETSHLPADDRVTDPAIAQPRARALAKAATAIVPASFLRLCDIVALHSDPQRYALLYRLLWRLVHEPGLRHDPIDADMLHAHQMGQAVRRDIHKMKATLEFRPMSLNGDGAAQVAWYEPTHHVLESVAPWFAKRMPQQPFAIFTPERSVHWDTEKLHYAHGLPASEAPAADDGASWTACFKRIFAH